MIAKDVGKVQHAKDKREHTEYDGTYVYWAGPDWLGPSCSVVFGFLFVLLHIFGRLVMVWSGLNRSTRQQLHDPNVIAIGVDAVDSISQS